PDHVLRRPATRAILAGKPSSHSASIEEFLRVIDAEKYTESIDVNSRGGRERRTVAISPRRSRPTIGVEAVASANPRFDPTDRIKTEESQAEVARALGYERNSGLCHVATEIEIRFQNVSACSRIYRVNAEPDRVNLEVTKPRSKRSPVSRI